ncbi:type VII secretion system-associated protein [Streptomyces sp. NBC_01275]|uniref:type VII secretion system-associated protein n=1 Tax=Streptomyces sp. NBC_01275 TaxID=2903807 RepID=UPI00224E5AF5|nr:type VII secretion system-associated protein [Streptomyces sp. NBC_01275]MCX4765873.1 type VII secretion system-associated protein [Streptomyces sp. NBC_01275]
MSEPTTDTPTTDTPTTDTPTTDADATAATATATATATDPDATTAIDPAPPEEFVKAAKLLPDHWLYYVDPTWRGEGQPPEWAVVGQWRTDLDGEIIEWQDNEAYKPSPDAHGWPEPLDVIDAAIQLATTGYAPAETVTRELATAELAVLVALDGTPVSAAKPDGTAVILAFSSPAFLHRYGELSFELIKTPDLLDRLPADHSLCVNPSATVSMVVDTDALRAAVAAAETEAEAEAATAATSRVPTESGALANDPPTSADDAATDFDLDLSDFDFGIAEDDVRPPAEPASEPPAEPASAPSAWGN